MQRKWWFAEILIGVLLTVAVFAIGYALASKLHPLTSPPVVTPAPPGPQSPEAVPPTQSIFGFEAYLGTLALMMIVLTLTDYRYKFRLLAGVVDLQRVMFVGSALVGVVLLGTTISSGFGWPPGAQPYRLTAEAVVGSVFLALVVWASWVALFSPAGFSRWNAKRYFSILYHRLLAGDESEGRALARELGPAMESVCRLSVNTDSVGEHARLVLMLIADKRFCRTLVEASPMTGAIAFRYFAKHKVPEQVVGRFARNFGTELILNKNSFLHAESSGYEVGLVGQWKPLSKEVFGNADLVEALAAYRVSPLDVKWPENANLTAVQFEALLRAARIFTDGYLKNAESVGHSYALGNLLDLLADTARDVGSLGDERKSLWSSDTYQRLRLTVDFVRDTIRLVEKRNLPTTSPLRPDMSATDLDNGLARLIVELIKGVAFVSEPPDTCWTLQHNTVWGPLFSVDDGPHWRSVRFKVRRLLFDEIVDMDKFANFQSARVLGYCLNVLGLSKRRAKGYGEESNALRLASQAYVARKFAGLRRDYPDVAKAILIGSLSFDEETNEIVKTFAKFVDPEPKTARLKVDPPPAKKASKSRAVSARRV